jgi:radical SAM protein with 4Fe4S-binding SPASM domain
MTTDTTSSFLAFKAPLYVAWEITHVCNACCVHCYSASGPHVRCESALTTEEALSVIDQLAAAGVLVLAFSGGEPLLRKDWPQLVGRASERGLHVNVGTNGSTITERTADQLLRLGVKSVTVSIDSDKPALHDEFRRLPGLHELACGAVRLLARRDVRVVVGYTPTRLNFRDGRGVVELAHALGASAVNLSEYVPAGRGGVDLALRPDELRRVLESWIAMRDEYRGRLDLIWHDCRVGLLVNKAERRDYVGCGAGRLVARILPDGTVTPCVFLPTAIGSLRAEEFQSMWSRSQLLKTFRERAGHIGGNCGDCRYLSTCGGCRAVAYAYSGGDALAGDPHCWIEPQAPVQLSLRRLPEGEGLPV